MDGWSKSSCGCVVVSRSRGGGTCRRCKWPAKTITTVSKKVPKCVATSHFFFFLFFLLVETAAKLRPSLALKFLESSTSIRKEFYWPKSIAYHHCCCRRNQIFSVWYFEDDSILILSEMKVKCKNFYCLLFVITL